MMLLLIARDALNSQSNITMGLEINIEIAQKISVFFENRELQ